jgi:hypothetical protein
MSCEHCDMVSHANWCTEIVNDAGRLPGLRFVEADEYWGLYVGDNLIHQLNSENSIAELMETLRGLYGIDAKVIYPVDNDDLEELPESLSDFQHEE